MVTISDISNYTKRKKTKYIFYDIIKSLIYVQNNKAEKQLNIYDAAVSNHTIYLLVHFNSQVYMILWILEVWVSVKTCV